MFLKIYFHLNGYQLSLELDRNEIHQFNQCDLYIQVALKLKSQFAIKGAYSLKPLHTLRYFAWQANVDIHKWRRNQKKERVGGARMKRSGSSTFFPSLNFL